MTIASQWSMVQSPLRDMMLFYLAECRRHEATIEELRSTIDSLRRPHAATIEELISTVEGLKLRVQQKKWRPARSCRGQIEGGIEQFEGGREYNLQYAASERRPVEIVLSCA